MIDNDRTTNTDEDIDRTGREQEVTGKPGGFGAAGTPAEQRNDDDDDQTQGSMLDEIASIRTGGIDRPDDQ